MYGHGNESTIIRGKSKLEKHICLYHMYIFMCIFGSSPGVSVVKNLPVNARDAGDAGSIPGSGRYPGEGNGNPL